MGNINIQELSTQMLTAASGILKDHWNQAEPLARKGFADFGENIKMIAQLKAEGKITEEQAKIYIDIQRSSIRIVLLTIEGLGVLAVEGAINAAIGVVKETVNTTIGWAIL